MLSSKPAFARRGCDGLAQIGPSRFDLLGLRFLTDNEGNDTPDAPAFPADTPVKDMTPDQQVAFHQAKARKLEDRLKAFGGKTPEEIAQMQADLDAARAATQTAEEKAIQDAEQRGRESVLPIVRKERATNALKAALHGREVDAFTLAEALQDTSNFVDGDQADMAKIAAWVDENTTEKAKVGGANLSRFQGPHEQIETTDRETGKAEAQKRFGTN